MRTRSLLLAAMLGGVPFAAQAQETLSELVTQAGTEWMVGNWEGTTDDGNTLTHSFAWDLNKQVIIMRGKAGEVEYLGVTALDPSTKEPRYIGFDSRGTVSKGVWTEDAGGVLLKIESDSPERGKRTWAVAFAKANSGDLEIRMHGVDDAGSVVQPPGVTITLKKAKK